MDEVTYVVELLKQNWASAATAVGTANHQTTPTIIDIRNLDKNKGRRFDLSQKVEGESTSDLIIVFEDGQEIEYPTVTLDVRNETYNMTIHIRVIQDQREQGFSHFGRDRLNSLYRIARYILESKRKGSTVTFNNESQRFDLITLGTRSESNDRNKRLFGYKIGLTLKKFAISIP